MTSTETAVDYGNQVWQEDRRQRLEDGRVARLWVRSGALDHILEKIDDGIGLDKDLSRQSPHPGNDADDAKKILKRIRKVVNKSKGKYSIVVPMSGFDILSLEKFAVEPFGPLSPRHVVEQSPAAVFFDALGEAYINDPNKTDPPKHFSRVRDIFSQARKNKTEKSRDSL